MLNENIKILRKEKSLSQEELAERLHVVRQTVSKWEKGISVPDAQMLIKIADVFEASVGTLLGDNIETTQDTNQIAKKLEQLNILLAEKNKRSRTIWKVVIILLIVVVVIPIILQILVAIFSFAAFNDVKTVEVTEMVGCIERVVNTR